MKSWYIIFFQCPILPEVYFRSFDLSIFNGMFADLKEPVSDDVIEAYKFAFRDKGIVRAGNTKGGSFTVPLTSCLTDLD